MRTKNLDDMLGGKGDLDKQKRQLNTFIVGMVLLISIALFVASPDQPDILIIGAITAVIIHLAMRRSGQSKL
jgi:hypothetical protein